MDLSKFISLKNTFERENPGFSIKIIIEVNGKLEPDPTEGTPSWSPAKKIVVALAVLSQHPDWTNAQIADVVGCHVNYLSKSPQFRNARLIVKGLGEEDLRYGI